MTVASRPLTAASKSVANDDSNKNIDSALDKHGSYEGDTANIARVVQRRLKRARRQLGRYPEKEVPTVLVLVNLSQNDPRAVSPPAVAEMLYGSPAVFLTAFLLGQIQMAAGGLLLAPLLRLSFSSRTLHMIFPVSIEKTSCLGLL